MRAAVLFAGLIACSFGSAESVPLLRDHGTFLVPVVLNNSITLNFTIDSGATDVSVPEDVVSTLIRTGSISRDDFLQAETYQLADGSTQTARRLRIRSLRLGKFELHDVMASVAPPAGSLLLGQSFLTKLNTWTIDNQRGLLILKEPESNSDISQLPEPEPREAKWNLLGKGTNGMAAYADIFDARVVNGRRLGWYKHEYPSHQFLPVPNDSRWATTAIILFEFDCSQRTIVERAAYDYLNDGTEYTEPGPHTPSMVGKGSISELDMNYVCGDY
jgi:clan AA aspartic protease (TIGR02281 family)